jgi:DNA invertase Pin-like site-specific DNA recombinase
MAIALYARKSVERENSISCETQIEYCRAMLKPDERSKKVLTFIDNGFSGGNTDRDGFQKMMRQVERGKISKVIIYRIDRISRSLSDFVGILETFKAHGVELVSSQESFDTSSPYGEMIVKLLVVFAEFERKSTIERVTQAYQHRSDLGIYMGGRRPYGFTLTETVIHGIKTKMLEPLETEAEQVRYIFDSYASGGISLRRLMDNLVQNNILPSEGSWSTAKISAILKNPVYVRADNAVYEYYAKQGTRIVSEIAEFDGIHGLQLYGKTTHKAEDWSDMKVVVMAHEGLVSSDTWLKCQRKLGQNKQIGNSMSNTTSWLGGRIICKQCGRTMTVTKGNPHADGTRTRYFSCTGKSHNRACKGSKVTLYADSLEDMVYELITEKLATLKDSRKQIATDNTGKVNLLKNRLTEIRQAEEKLVDLILGGAEPDMMVLLNQRAQKLAEEKREVSERMGALEAESTEVIHAVSLSGRWKKATYEERRSVCQLLIHQIRMDEDGGAEVVWNI